MTTDVLGRLREDVDAHGVECDGRIAAGSRTTVRHADRESEAYEPVAPGGANARLDRNACS